MKNIFFFFLSYLFCCNNFAQNDSAVYSKFTSLQNRTTFYNNLVNRSITKNLSFPLNIENESKWQNAFSAIELINYQQPWIDKKLKSAADSIEVMSVDFQRSFLEMLYAGNRKNFVKEVTILSDKTNDAKVFAMGANYLLLSDTSLKNRQRLLASAKRMTGLLLNFKDTVILTAFLSQLKAFGKQDRFLDKAAMENLFSNDFLKGNVVVYSVQRKDRNFTGISFVKDTSGEFIRDSLGAIIYIPQLARSLSNMPFYISNGNTPQGVYRLDGFGKSSGNFIGPSKNLQLTMPYETSIQHFLKDSTIKDSVWSKQLYARLIPKKLQNFEPLYQSFYAGAAGRTEIIAHGTAVDHNYYTGKTYYPFTPTAGCLCANEVWDSAGKRVSSDQQILSDAVTMAGGPSGYLIVIEINDQEKKVAVEEVLRYLPLIKNN